ncbi:flagellar biosynthesis protein FlhB [Mesobaculum littorinae]|uniref:Flagellar biosynthetic protein FlhB n=1 Tax=Mesobaculum littorinae TaxID=2486419 RepID=A0A438ADW4_9RHOB|nr:flagellar biosynthesis protein FlhB [Mesobaculum littorinae]RVV96884.1 flagellar biosynthesis protein FlhB [Mesobaculum littorinae]
MADEDKSNKTEEPTEQRLRKARQKGDVPSSREVGTMMTVFSLFVLTVFVIPSIIPDLSRALSGPFVSAGQIEIGAGAAGLADAGQVMGGLGRSVAVAVAPLFLIMVIAALFGVLIQGETVVATERIRPKFSKLNPASGLKRLFSADALVEFAKSVGKVLVIGAITGIVAQRYLGGVVTGEGMLPESLPDYARRAIAVILIAATIFLVPIAIFDIIWKRSQWIKKQRMTLQEVRDEHKESEGNPQVRARRADIRRRMARQRIAQAVPTASVILTNPTHFAVALRYTPGADTAPVCVAKGADLMARQIREIARDNEVPIVENKPLARALHDTVEVDDQVPMQYWQAVAEIIGYVMDLQRDIRRSPPKGSELRLDDD